MMREPGEAPQFDWLIEEIQKAKREWELGNRGKAEKMLNRIASVTYAEARERGPNDPVPEAHSR